MRTRFCMDILLVFRRLQGRAAFRRLLIATDGVLLTFVHDDTVGHWLQMDRKKLLDVGGRTSVT